MEIGTMTNMCYSFRGSAQKTSALEATRRLRAVGFSAQDLFLCGLVREKHCCSFSADDWRREALELREEMVRLGVVFHQAHLPYSFLGRTWNPKHCDFNELFRRMLERSLDICCLLNIPCGVVHPFSAANVPPDEFAPHIEENLRRYEALTEKATASGICIAFENMNDVCSFGSTAAQLNALLQAFPGKNVGVCWDTGHGQIVYGDKQVTAIGQLSGRICALHVHDNHGKHDEHLPPFMGNIAWEKVMPALRLAGFRGNLNYEVGVNAGVPDHLRDETARYCFRAGKYLIRMFEKGEP